MYSKRTLWQGGSKVHISLIFNEDSKDVSPSKLYICREIIGREKKCHFCSCLSLSLSALILQGSGRMNVVVEDSREGWRDALKIILQSYFFGHREPTFDMSLLRCGIGVCHDAVAPICSCRLSCFYLTSFVFFFFSRCSLVSFPVCYS